MIFEINQADSRAIYRHTKLILGEPAKAEVCGYAHGDKDGRSLVAIAATLTGTRAGAVAHRQRGAGWEGIRL